MNVANRKGILQVAIHTEAYFACGECCEVDPAAPYTSILIFRIHKFIRKRIEVVITALTRNQVARKGSWVRIPPLPPAGSARTQQSGNVRLYAEFIPRYFFVSKSILGAHCFTLRVTPHSKR